MLHLFVFVTMILIVQNTQTSDKKSNKEQNEDLIISTNIFNSCIIISYNYLTQQDGKVANELNKIMEAYEDIYDFEEKIYQQFIASKRIKLEAAKHCVKKQTVEGAQKILSELQNRKFNAQNYYYMMDGFLLTNFFNRQIEYKFTKDDDTLFQIIEEFLQKLREAQGIPEIGINDLYPQMYNDDMKTKIFGVAIESSWLSYMVFFSVAFVIILIMKYAYTTLQDSQKNNSNKQKKQKK